MFLNGITVVLCGKGKAFDGATVAWTTKVEKNHLMVSLPSGAAVTNAVLSKRVFSISVLGERQADIARQYGGSKQTRPLPRSMDDLDFGVWEVPIVKHCRANLLCTAVENTAIGEQLVIIAAIEKSSVSESVLPLVYDHADYFI